MGSILTALELGKPIIVMPRRRDLGEHRNDHQLATAAHFRERGNVRVAQDERELEHLLDDLATLRPAARISKTASPALIAALRAFVRQPDGRRPAPKSPFSPSAEMAAEVAAARV
jgi:UDP-N-acetylglucosamine transferase subunit ALG13